jgi:transglutaminase-like putative cysteine protease
MTNSDYLQPTAFIDCESPSIQAFAYQAVNDATSVRLKAINLYTAVRDSIAYDPYDNLAAPGAFTAQRALDRQRGFCIPKAALLVACARAQGIPARLGFADVRNHLSSPRMIELNGSDVFRWHCYTELYLEGSWVKATPAFDADLCRRAGLTPLDFDGEHDSVFHPFDSKNRKHMEYLNHRGHFLDVPYDKIIASWKKHSPGLLEERYYAGSANFASEVARQLPINDESDRQK